jgi:hypothetical protein
MSTHGVVHPNVELAKKDVDILKEHGAGENTLWVTEISEKDYTNRPDQAKEISYLEEIL